MGEPALRAIATELVGSIKSSVSVDWMHREAARARMRVLVKRLLRKYGYPPDLQDAAVQKVLQQAEALSAEVGGLISDGAHSRRARRRASADLGRRPHRVEQLNTLRVIGPRAHGACSYLLSRIAQLDQRTALPDQCLYSAEAEVRPQRRKSGLDPGCVKT